jgi:hypothetical protein
MAPPELLGVAAAFLPGTSLLPFRIRLRIYP